MCVAERYHVQAEEASTTSKKRYFKRLNSIQLAKIERSQNLKSLHPCDTEHKIIAFVMRNKYRVMLKQELASWTQLVNTAHERFKDASIEHHKMILSGRATEKQVSRSRVELRRLRDLVAQRERRFRETKRKLK